MTSFIENIGGSSRKILKKEKTHPDSLNISLCTFAVYYVSFRIYADFSLLKLRFVARLGDKELTGGDDGGDAPACKKRDDNAYTPLKRRNPCVCSGDKQKSASKGGNLVHPSFCYFFVKILRSSKAIERFLIGMELYLGFSRQENEKMNKYIFIDLDHR